MAEELGASVETTRRAALLHDIGKAVSHEVEGPHALVGGRIARRHGEPEAVAHAIEAHHNEVEPKTVEAVLVQAADAVSGARPGARGDALEQYVGRLRDLEEIASRHHGVERVFAMRAGREVRVIVDPGEVDDERAALISHEIATAVEKELEFPGRIKVTVIRESRSTASRAEREARPRPVVPIVAPGWNDRLLHPRRRPGALALIIAVRRAAVRELPAQQAGACRRPLFVAWSSPPPPSRGRTARTSRSTGTRRSRPGRAGPRRGCAGEEATSPRPGAERREEPARAATPRCAPEAATASIDGAQVFNDQGCGGCHTLDDGETADRPVLDAGLKGEDTAFIENRSSTRTRSSRRATRPT